MKSRLDQIIVRSLISDSSLCGLLMVIANSKKTFGKDKLRLNLLQEKLKVIQGKPHTPSNFEQEQEVVKEMEILLLRQDMMLHQRSRVNWLLYGDKTLAFFHACINQRRQRNQILMLKSNRGDWIEDEDGIKDLIGNYFTGLFTHSGQRDFSAALSVVPRSITEEMNAKLIQNMTNEEIKNAVFQMGSLKAPEPDRYP
ncbi:hypothetical protein Vadar_030853 [Vaccinium darrowii]|uniref:Uncharacterized protein n=1 Tax=Vaccinium darrowii TaxID=229202 RepID=A0ACB7XDQ5_9ERIC|nr:hypothetical protein Vadar_030853 [Vaccinium darrowii]